MPKYDLSILIPLTEEFKVVFLSLLDAHEGTSKRLKNIYGTDVYIMKITYSMKPAIYLENGEVLRLLS